MHPVIGKYHNVLGKQIVKEISKTRIQFKKRRAKILTEINLAPIHIRLGEGKGNNKRPTPYIATAKKWTTKLNGRGLRPESRETGPVEQTPPRLK